MIKKIFHIFSYLFIAVILVTYTLLKFVPDLLKPISSWLGIDCTNIEISIILACSFLIIDKLNVIMLLVKTSTSQLIECDTEEDAYNKLEFLFKDKRIESIKAVQVSGQTIQQFLAKAKTKDQNTNIKLALLSDEQAKIFDTDKDTKLNPYHINRRIATTSFLNNYHRINTNIKLYESYPSACIVIINNNTAFLGWYRNYYNNDRILALSSHDVPGVIAKKGTPLFKFAADQFEKVWSTASDES